MGPYAQGGPAGRWRARRRFDAILTGTGPGLFTGLRAGIVTARALGFAWSVPVYGMMSLTALAERAVSGVVAGDTVEEENVERAFASAGSAELVEGAELLVLSDARRREVTSPATRVNGEGYSLVDGPNVCSASKFCPVRVPPTPTVTGLACTPRPSKNTAGPSSILPVRFTRTPSTWLPPRHVWA